MRPRRNAKIRIKESHEISKTGTFEFVNHRPLASRFGDWRTLSRLRRRGCDRWQRSCSAREDDREDEHEYDEEPEFRCSHTLQPFEEAMIMVFIIHLLLYQSKTVY